MRIWDATLFDAIYIYIYINDSYKKEEFYLGYNNLASGNQW
jgi:hypothetical protein